MFGTHAKNQPVLTHLLADERGFFDRAFDEAKLSRAIDHRLGDLRRVTDADSQIDLGMILTKTHQTVRQPIARNRLTSLYCKCTPLKTSQLAQRELGRRCPGKYPARLLEEQSARFGQLDPPADTVKQRGRIGIFQRDDCSADRLLRQVQSFGRARHVLTFGDGNEDAELLEGHCRRPPISSLAPTTLSRN